jgi:Mg-chelatase subunit ChlD
MRTLNPLLGAWITAGLVGAAQAEPNPPAVVQVEIKSPQPGALVRGRFDMLDLAGFAQAGAKQASFDVMLVIDVSASTLYPSGLDVDGDGVLGAPGKKPLVPGFRAEKNTDPEDSILAAELVAAGRMLQAMDPARVRLGVVSFSGEADPITLRRRRPDQSDALLEQALTRDYSQIEAALEALRLRGASGGTNMEAGIKLAIQELAGLTGASSQPEGDAQRVILMLTDGRPSLPFGSVEDEDPEDTQSVISAAGIAKEAGIRINVFGLGPGATEYPEAVTQLARISGGLYTPVRRAGDIVALLTGVSFANVDDVVAVNLTMGEMSGKDDVAVFPDGSFRGFVPVQPGRNRIRVSALASDGTRGSQEVEVEFVPQELSNNELGEELERVRQRNREIQILTERKRQEAFRETERQRALSVEVEDEKPKPAKAPEKPKPAPAP